EKVPGANIISVKEGDDPYQDAVNAMREHESELTDDVIVEYQDAPSENDSEKAEQALSDIADTAEGKSVSVPEWMAPDEKVEEINQDRTDDLESTGISVQEARDSEETPFEMISGSMNRLRAID